MKATETIRTSLGLSSYWILSLAEDMSDSPLTFPTPNGGNHPLWCLGHLAYSEANLVSVFCKGEEHPLADWEGIFKQGTEVSSDPENYPPYEEVIAKLKQVRETTLGYLDTLSDDDLDNPSHAGEELKDWFGTVGICLSMITIHYCFHGGQIADARRAAGKAPLVG